MTNDTVGSRIKALRESLGISQSKLAKLAGVAQPTLSSIERGEQNSSKRIVEFARVLKVTPDFLLYGDNKPLAKDEGNGVMPFIPLDLWDDETPLDTDDIEVPFLKDIKLSAGNGALCYEDFNGFKLRFSKRTLKRFNVSPKDAVCVSVQGNSMSPVIPDGATIGVDLSAKNIISGEIYAFLYKDELFIKVLHTDIGYIRAFSYNTMEYPERQLQSEEITVIGRVFWWSIMR